MTVDVKAIKAATVASARDLGVCDPDSVFILAIAYTAQAALHDEISAMRSDGVNERDVIAFREERSEDLSRWIHNEIEKVRMRSVAREEVARCIS